MVCCKAGRRLISATAIYGTLSYTYDAADNRLTRNLSAAVTGLPARTITSDNAGLASRAISATLVDDIIADL